MMLTRGDDNRNFAIDMVRMQADIANENAYGHQRKAYIAEKSRDSYYVLIVIALIGIALGLWVTGYSIVIVAVLIPIFILVTWYNRKLDQQHIDDLRKKQLEEFERNREN